MPKVSFLSPVPASLQWLGQNLVRARFAPWLHSNSFGQARGSSDWIREASSNSSGGPSLQGRPHPWGKSVSDTWHHLAHHCADVAACFLAWLETPVIRGRLEAAAGRKLSTSDVARLAVLVFLHDTGKLHPGFQAKAWPEGPGRPPLRGHVAEGLAALWCGHRGKPAWRVCDGQIASALHVPLIRRWCGGDPEPLLRATIGHHGRPFSVDHLASTGWEAVPAMGYDPLAAARELGELLPRWFPAAFQAGGEVLPRDPRFLHLLCGIMTLMDWVGSNRAVFPFQPDPDPDYFWRQAWPSAKRALAGMGLDSRVLGQRIGDVTGFACVAPGRAPRPAQAALAAWPLDDPLVILEAETGSGKTEAALWRFARLFAAGCVDGLYFAVPTRAAARQLHGRVSHAMKALFRAQSPEPVLAIPGYMQAGDATGMLVEHRGVIWDDAPPAGQSSESQLLARWAAESSKRFLAATVAVGTVDQAMLAALEVKHAHLRAASLARSLLVVDEAHASDRYMARILRALLDAHLGWGGHALLMSATLGASARVRWLSQGRPMVPGLAEAAAEPYPALSSRRSPISAITRGEGQAKRVAMVSHHGWSGQDAARLAIPAAAASARVLIIRNTVCRAIETLDAVVAQGGSALLWQMAGAPAVHHSRFAAEDRDLLDREVEQVLAPRRSSPGPGVIVIGTQTLEQSLDIDADLLITDLCPVDVLLQRIGRLHRHAGLRPPGFEAARCHVLAPAEGLDRLAAPSFDNGLGAFTSGAGLEGVYLNLPSAALTLHELEAQPVWEIPAMNRALVEAATHDEAIETFVAEAGPAWQRYWHNYAGRAMADTLAADHVVLPFDAPLVDEEGTPLLFLGDEQAVRTRLGAEGAMIRFHREVIGPFGTPVSRITLPAHWSRGLAHEDAPVAPEVREDGTLAFALEARRFVYSRRGLERARHA